MKINEIINLVIIVACLALNIIILCLLIRKKHIKNNQATDLNDIAIKAISANIEAINKSFIEQINLKYDDLKKSIDDLKNNNNAFHIELIKLNNEFNEKILIKAQSLNDSIIKQQLENASKLDLSFKDINKLVSDNNEKSIKAMNERLNEFTLALKEKVDLIDKSVATNLENIRKDNNEKLDKIQGVVDEKLQNMLEERLNNSFKNVLEQISGVNKTIGEIKSLASDVSSLKNVFANVKIKGIVGEVILGNLIREILVKGQYEENVKTKKGSNDAVEYAIKMPGNDGNFIYLPVDSKFPTESYNKILNAINSNNKEAIDTARKELKNNIKKFASEIANKYIDEPNTTSFAIMFLPIEGLYAEVINMDLFEELQRDYKICVCGPSTFSALLNALQMGFKTLIIQKKSAEIFKLLGAIKTEFNSFADALEKTQIKMDQAGKELNNLVGVRTRVIKKKLKDVEELDEDESKKILMG
ncbi:MAG: DNA recombination protein RmuC [Candidatus Caccosoma sp.]|nr:DNA recombination protein RmuC [Candidatus Caccosoma sp.]